MKLPKTKAQIRAELNQQVKSFLAKGGDIQDVPRGISGNVDNSNIFSQGSDPQPRQDRTPLSHVVKEMEARKQAGKTKASASTESRRKKVLITDDFGEPVRWVWVDGDQDPKRESDV